MFECLFCGSKLINWGVIDRQDFEGESSCPKCRLLYEIKIVDGVEIENKLKGAIATADITVKYAHGGNSDG